MYVTELVFECFDNTTISAVEKAVNGLMDVLRYNGQVYGREFPLLMGEGEFRVRAVCPEKDSLHEKNHSPQVKASLKQLADASLLRPKVKVLGRDVNSEDTYEPGTPPWQLLYTTYVHTCSPLRSGDTLQPIPLYRLPATFNGDHKAVVKWQTEWQACDELQMAGASKIEFPALAEMQEVGTDLFRRGWDLRGRIEFLTGIPTYYYQYRVGGESKEQEVSRCCPKCGGDWALKEPLHDIFYFKCDECRLISNMSWDFL